MSEWTDEHQTMLDDCEQRESRLSEWEQGFISSIQERAAAGHGITPKQAETLEKIWERATAKG